MNKREWFGEWFDSPYYHILYRQRDMVEAQQFITNVLQKCKPKPGSKFLDVACGRGRHSIYLNQKGFDVTGIDISEKNLSVGKVYENDRLHFVNHDMRDVFMADTFDFVFNFFTSFGFFDTKEEHQLAISAISVSMKKGGFFLLDFLNSYKVINQLVESETKIIDGIKFTINRKYDGEFIYKDIVISHSGELQYFQEKVKAIQYDEFAEYFTKAGLSLKATFGDYELNKFKKEKSGRMIFLTQL